jgi:H+-translocating NAD(P) transhydrogenase subunit alpha
MPNRDLTVWLMACWLLLGLAVMNRAQAQTDDAEVDSGPPVTAPVELESPTAPDAPEPAAPSPLAALATGLTIFVLAIFVGFEVITKVPPTLHTPLMSGSNAISGITVVGAIWVTGNSGGATSFFAMLAVALAMINVVGGFWVTNRMLSMFRRK